MDGTTSRLSEAHRSLAVTNVHSIRSRLDSLPRYFSHSQLIRRFYPLATLKPVAVGESVLESHLRGAKRRVARNVRLAITADDSPKRRASRRRRFRPVYALNASRVSFNRRSYRPHAQRHIAAAPVTVAAERKIARCDQLCYARHIHRRSRNGACERTANLTDILAPQQMLN